MNGEKTKDREGETFDVGREEADHGCQRRACVDGLQLVIYRRGWKTTI